MCGAGCGGRCSVRAKKAGRVKLGVSNFVFKSSRLWVRQRKLQVFRKIRKKSIE